MKKLFKYSLFIVLSFYFSNTSFGQEHSNDEEKTVSKALETISKYSYSQSNLVDDELERMGYNPPFNISQSQWKKYPTIRKIEMAYVAAENASTNGGQKMLALLSQSLAQEYESAAKDPVIQKFKIMEAPYKIPFLHPQTFPITSSLSNEIQQAVGLIAKYADNDAIGGLHGILTNHFEIDENEAYELQRNSNSTKEALQKGISKYDDVKIQKTKISKVIGDLHDSYESSRFEKDFEPFRNNGTKYNGGDFGFEQNNKPPPLPIGPSSGSSPSTFDSKKQYSNFVKRNYENSSSRSFSKMKTSSGGFGGVIFGSKVQKDLKLPTLDSVIWLPDNQGGEMESGTLEFNYKTGEKKYIRGIILEDLYAAYNIIYTMQESLANYVEGDGIGLASLSFAYDAYIDYEGREKREVLLHPAVANLPIGWSLVYSDIAPIIKTNIVSKIKNQHDSMKVREVLSSFSNWKVTDVPVTVSFEEDELSIKKTDSKEGVDNEIYFSMNKLSGGFFSWENDFESTTFDEISSILCKYDYNYKRLNEFAKTFLTLRYVKMEGAKIFTLPEYSKYTIQPHFITFELGKVSFETPIEEGSKWRDNVKSQFAEYMVSVGKNEKIKGLLDTLNTIFTVKNKYRDDLWHQINDYYYLNGGIEPICANSKKGSYNYPDLDSALTFNSDDIIEALAKNEDNEKKLNSLSEKLDSLRLALVDVNTLLDNKEDFLITHCPDIWSQYDTLQKALRGLSRYSSEYDIKFAQADSLLNSCTVYMELLDKQEVLYTQKSEVYQSIQVTQSLNYSPSFIKTMQKEKSALLYILDKICK